MNRFRTSQLRHSSRRGFTLLEVSLVAGLTSFLVLMVPSTWTAFGRSMSDAIIRSKVAQEANLALAALQGDLGGYLPEQEGGD
jgi:type II secretory pathway pseudopilin PulG